MIRTMMLGLTAATLAACSPSAPVAPAETPEELVAQGEYIVTRVAFCGDCHTPWAGDTLDATRTLQGGPTGLSPPLSAYAPALAGIPSYFTEEEFTQILMTGVRPNGSTPKPPMPRYRLSEHDARAVTAYIRTVPPAPDAGE